MMMTNHNTLVSSLSLVAVTAATGRSQTWTFNIVLLPCRRQKQLLLHMKRNNATYDHKGPLKQQTPQHTAHGKEYCDEKSCWILCAWNYST